MTVLFHPGFPGDIRKFEANYLPVSIGLAVRFRKEVSEAVEAIQTSPRGAGHLLGRYGIMNERLIFGAIIPSRSDPLTWLARFSGRG